MNRRPRRAIRREVAWSVLTLDDDGVTLLWAGHGRGTVTRLGAADVDVTLKRVDFVVHPLTPIVGLIDWLLDPPPPGSASPTRRAGWCSRSCGSFYTMVRACVTDWYPYPFLDPDQESAVSIVVTGFAIIALFLLFALTMRWWAERRRRSATDIAIAM